MDLKVDYRGQMSDTLFTAIFIVLSGGFQDAYTYGCRGGVFANAQTGNIVLLSTALFRHEWDIVIKYAIPVLSFLLGAAAALLVRLAFGKNQKLHWRQIVLAIEIVILAGVTFISSDRVANALVSFVCAMQVMTFRKVRGLAYASTMCIGNMRSGAEELGKYVNTRDREHLHSALTYFGVIVIFAFGAGLGSLLTQVIGKKAILVSCGLLFISFCLMFIDLFIRRSKKTERRTNE